MAAYADYAYYTDDFGGTLIPQEMFNRSVNMAGRYINMFTYGQITEENKDSIDGLQDCACDMAESVYKMLYSSAAASAGGEKKSETIDGYSVSYVTAQKDGEDIRTVLARNLYALATLYLSESGLLFAGVNDCCDYEYGCNCISPCI